VEADRFGIAAAQIILINELLRMLDSSGNNSKMDKTVSGSGWEVWLLFLGFIGFFVISYLAKDTTIADVTFRNGRFSGDLITWPILICFTAGLFMLFVGNYFCTKNSEGKFQYKNRHMWVRPVIFILFGLLSSSFGWVLAFSSTVFLQNQ
jgi:hypothetical protein